MTRQSHLHQRGGAPDSPRWCDRCRRWGDHHTDRHPEPELAPPKKGEVYRHSALRGQWTVKSCGPQWITLTPSIPYLRNQRIPTSGFLAAGWERVR